MSALARLLFLTLCLLALRPVPAPAHEDGSRQYTLMLRGGPFAQALEELVKVSELDLIFSSSLAEGKVVYCNARNLRVEAILRCILNNTGLDFVRTSA